MNYERFNTIVERIEEDMSLWDQNMYYSRNVMNNVDVLRGGNVHEPPIPCSTACCIAGHAALDCMAKRGGKSAEERLFEVINMGGTGAVHETARVWLELTEHEADWLFSMNRSWYEIKAFSDHRERVLA